jgi:hypothetical protein
MLTIINFTLRMPAYVCALLDREAIQDGRTRNQMIIRILRERYKLLDDDPKPDAPPSARPKRNKQKFKALN